VIIDGPSATVHTRSDRWLSTFEEGTQRSYAYHLVDHLRWLDSVGLDEEHVDLDHLKRYLGLCGATVAGPMGVPWLDEPLAPKSLSARAAALKGYYLSVLTRERINTALCSDLTAARLPHRAARDSSMLGHMKTSMPGNPLAPSTPPRRHPRLNPEGARPALLDVVNTARDRMIIVWLSDSGMRVGELCGLHFVDMHLVRNHECGEMVEPHVHVVKRTTNPNRARAKLGSAATSGAVIRGGRLVRVSPAMRETYDEYLTTDYFEFRAVAQHDMVLICLQNDEGKPLSTHGVRQMLQRAGVRAGLGRINPHSFRHTWATALTEATDGNTAAVAEAGGWASSKTVERTYLHLRDSDTMNEALEKVWSQDTDDRGVGA
jgi:integrase